MMIGAHDVVQPIDGVRTGDVSASQMWRAMGTLGLAPDDIQRPLHLVGREPRGHGRRPSSLR